MTTAGVQVDLECFLWDLVDEGVEDALDRIKGETGVTGIVVPVLGRELLQFRPHPGVSPRSYTYDGGAMFQPDSTRYASTRLRPVVAETLRKSNPLKAVVEACRARGLNVGCNVAACSARRVAERYEHAASCDVFGDRGSWLCPVNPDVQEYIRGLLADLTENYPLDSLRLRHVGFPWSSSGGLPTRFHELRGFAMGPVELWLRTICFCESCRQLSKRDEIDVDAAARIAGETLEAACRSGGSVQDSIADFVEQHEPLAAFLVWRRSQLQRWIASLKTACQCPLTGEAPPQPEVDCLPAIELSDAFDNLYRTCGQTGAETVDATLAGLDAGWDPSRIILGISARSDCPSSEDLVAAVVRAVQSGCRAVAIGDYGSVPLDRLDWIRQAVRFARREST